MICVDGFRTSAPVVALILTHRCNAWFCFLRLVTGITDTEGEIIGTAAAAAVDEIFRIEG
jgi:hypothetical protein